VKKEIIASGKNLNEAKENARLALGAGELDDVTFEIIDLGSKGIFGIGARPTKVKASMELPDAEPRRERRERKAPRETAESNLPRRERAPRQEGDKPAAREKQQPAREKSVKREAPKSAAIPETELHFEEVNAAPGDDRALDFVNTLIADLGLEDVSAKLLRCDDGTRRVSISGENASVLIGHHGDTLDALQYLANLATAQKDEKGERDRSRVTIDIEGYRAKREETLRQLARRMANKALAKGSKVTLEPMTPYERRIIHSEVQSIEGVTTQSIGSDNNRRIVIYVERPTKAKAQAEPKEEPENTTVDVSDVSDESLSAVVTDTETPDLEKTDD
jgi:spoIIIJ-associated protein